jgi:16S rRNA (cytidine1402-2'-O)-methyltransferase
MASKKGKLILIPTTLGASDAQQVIPEGVLQKSRELKHFLAENERSARRYLKSINTNWPLDELELFILDKNTTHSELPKLLKPLHQGIDMGIISEAGMPGIADPGALAVSYAHQHGIPVKTSSGPSSILMALTGSGFSGQQFTFHGYLPIERKERMHALRNIEKEVRRSGASQIFMETPFRNDKLLDQIIQYCSQTTDLCIATDLSLDTEKISTKPIGEWAKHRPQLHKRPAIFIIGRPQ